MQERASDDMLLERAVRGDRAALWSLLERAAPSVRGRVAEAIPAHRRALLSVDDVMQEAYTDAFLAIGRFEPRGFTAFVAWLAALANGNVHDALDSLDAAKRGGDWRRLEAAQCQASSVRLDSLLAATTTTPSGQVCVEEAHAALRRAIAMLPESNRLAVEMYELQGHSIDEVASALGRSHGAVYMLRSRGIAVLRQLMDPASTSPPRHQ